MKNIWRQRTGRSITFALCFFGALCSIATVARAQMATCGVVRAAYSKSFSAGATMATKNGPGVNVTQAQAEITGDGSYQETCKFLRDETINGEAASVQSDVMKSHAGTADSKVWISKAKGLILQQEVEVDMGAKGKGKQTIVFNYKK